MTRREVKNAAKVMLAYVDGADIQLRPRGCERWETLDDDEVPYWDWSRYEYREPPSDSKENGKTQ